MPTPQELAALGPVLCLFCERYGGELAGWPHAARAQAHAGIDRDGGYEYIAFADADGCDCWRLYLLPDSDFFAWECLCERLSQSGAPLPRGCHEGPDERADECPHERAYEWPHARVASAGCASAGIARWRASVVRLHALRPPLQGVLAISPWSVSALGVEVVRAVLRREGIYEPSLR